jgi:PKD repeat protein
MNYGRFIVFISFLVVSACTKNNAGNSTPKSSADFSFDGSPSSDTVITVGTYDQILLDNQSSNASGYHWDFGNDSTSPVQNPVLWYANPGTYSITLTASDQNGHQSEKTKLVKVLNRYIRRISITGLQNLAGTAYQINASTKYLVLLKLGANHTGYPLPAVMDSSLDAPVIYQSPLLSGIDPTNAPYILTVPGNMALNLPALRVQSLNGLGYNGVGYGLELYGIDHSGKHLLSSSYQYYLGNGSGISVPVSDLERNIFTAQYGNLELNCDFQ